MYVREVTEHFYFPIFFFRVENKYSSRVFVVLRANLPADFPCPLSKWNYKLRVLRCKLCWGLGGTEEVYFMWRKYDPQKNWNIPANTLCKFQHRPWGSAAWTRVTSALASPFVFCTLPMKQEKSRRMRTVQNGWKAHFSFSLCDSVPFFFFPQDFINYIQQFFFFLHELGSGPRPTMQQYFINFTFFEPCVVI